MTWHITPTDDKKAHKEEGTLCECEPKVKIENGEMIVIHNAFDYREMIEQTKEVLNEKL